jgi:amphiphysin
LRETLSPIITASFSIIPHLLAAQILIQNTLLAQYYTILHNYCLEMQFPSPPPPMDDVISQWALDHNPIRQQAEAISVIVKGQGIRQHLNITSDMNGRRPSATSSLSSRNGAPGTSTARVMRIPSHTSQVSQTRAPPTPAAEETKQPTYAPEKKRPPPPPKKKNLSQYLYAEALYDFTGEGQGDLSFKEGDMIQVVKKTDSTDDWWEGRLNGVLGSFPANYCRIT